MYLQITTKCNMKCPHCCYSCSMRGKHAEWSTIVDSITFARNYNEAIVIGGGEPTLHPRFFDVLKLCLEDFDYVWMATNGSQTESMYRLANIIDQEDCPECNCLDELGEEEFDEYGCLCHERMDDDSIYQENKLSIALSQDCFHDPINQNVVDMWTRRAKNRESHFEIRNVSQANFGNGVIAMGRAKRTGSGWAEDCVCPDFLIRPDGKIKACGCTRSPVIGDVWSGITDKYEILLTDERFTDERCYKALRS